MKERAVRRKPAKETLRANIKDYIQKQIAAGVYQPGDRIVETQLARELNVSQHRCGRQFWSWFPWDWWRSVLTPATLCGRWGQRKLRISIRSVPW